MLKNELVRLRKEIDDIDDKILTILFERAEKSKKIARLKTDLKFETLNQNISQGLKPSEDLNMPTRDFEREAGILKRIYGIVIASQHSESEAKSICEIFKAVLNYSASVQKIK
jgi:chorismate mutase